MYAKSGVFVQLLNVTFTGNKPVRADYVSNMFEIVGSIPR